MKGKVFNLFLKNKITKLTYACVYYQDDAGVKLVFSNKYCLDIIEEFNEDKTRLINLHIKKYGCDIETYVENNASIESRFNLDKQWELFFV